MVPIVCNLGPSLTHEVLGEVDHIYKIRGDARATCSLYSSGFCLFRLLLQSDETFLKYKSDHVMPLLKCLADH